MPLTKDSDSADAPEKPLDPAAERLQKRLTGLVRTSGLIMAAGLLAVFSVILYRTIGGGAQDRRAVHSADIAVSAASGARILSTDLDGNALAMLVEDDSGRSVVVVDLSTGSVMSRVRLVAKPGAS